MNTQTSAVVAYLSTAGYAQDAIDAGLAYAEEHGGFSEDEILSLALSRALYSDDQLADGERYSVEAGSIDWSAYHG